MAVSLEMVENLPDGQLQSSSEDSDSTHVVSTASGQHLIIYMLKDSDEESEDDSRGRIACTCKSTCQTKRCPCHNAGLRCVSDCNCGSTSKPCMNRVSMKMLL